MRSSQAMLVGGRRLVCHSHGVQNWYSYVPLLLVRVAPEKIWLKNRKSPQRKLKSRLRTQIPPASYVALGSGLQRCASRTPPKRTGMFILPWCLVSRESSQIEEEIHFVSIFVRVAGCLISHQVASMCPTHVRALQILLDALSPRYLGT